MRSTLQYHETAQEMECALQCHRKFFSHACCEQGHYICDDRHARRGVEHIMDYCRSSRSLGGNPVDMVQEMMVIRLFICTGRSTMWRG